MKKYTITQKDGSTCSMTTGDEQVWIAWRDECIAVNIWGKPEREIVELSESYEESDVLSRRSESIGERTVNYVTLKAEYVIEIEDITDQYNLEQQTLEMLLAGERMEKACRAVLAYVTGYNNSRSFTIEQVSAFQTAFSNILTMIVANRPNTVRNLITATAVDGTLVTQKLKDGCLFVLTKHGF